MLKDISLKWNYDIRGRIAGSIHQREVCLKYVFFADVE